jgi:alpha-D-xyloside xylohydrolase
MKFTDGCWLLRDGVVAHYPREAYFVDSRDGAIEVLAPTKAVQHRGDTLQGPAITVRFSSPIDDVIRVTATHFSGGEPPVPQFAIQGSGSVDPKIVITPTSAQLTSGSLTVRINDLKSWDVEFSAAGSVLTRSKRQALGLFEFEGKEYLREQLNLGFGESVYGLGERFTAFAKNGQVVETWNKDGGTNSDQTYKNIPFYLTNRGYGVFVNHPENVSFEIASEKADTVQFSVEGELLDYFVIYGPTPKEILGKYTALTGRPSLPPPWSFGLWLTTSFLTNYDEETVTSFIQGMADRDLPLHVFHFDCFWMKEFHWCDFQWDQRVFPDPVGMLSRLKARGLKICVWINPYIAQKSSLFDEGAENGYFLKKPSGDVWQTDQWQPGMAIVDFTNPDARAWFTGKLKALLDMGVDAFKTDFGERIPTDVVYFDGSNPERMHNYYSYLYNKTVFDLLTKERGDGEAVLFARSGSVGSQSLPVHWGGDCESTFEAMAASLRGGLSLGLSGFGFWSHDIGGFEGTPPESLYKRWVAFGLLSSHSRLHGSSSYRVPWVYGDEAVDVLRHFTKLKSRLMPYLFNAAVEARDFGIPVMRAMVLEFPNDPATTNLDAQYLLGGSLLVTPVFTENNVVDYYVPAGKWTNFFTGDVLIGPTWVKEEHSFTSLPLLVRPNSIVATGSHDERPDYAYDDHVIYEIYQLDDGASATATVPNHDGSVKTTAIATRTGGVINIRVSGADKPWHIQLVGIPSVKTVTGGVDRVSERGLIIDADAGAAGIVVNLALEA